MPRKAKTPPTTNAAARKTLSPPYASLAEGPPSAERLAALLEQSKAGGRRPMTAQEFDRFMQEPSDWPADENIDDFIAWLRKRRREDRA